ncbi:flagellar brake protein [Methylobacter sp. S3L5C]|uniref:flagellar brake protein n=1 Tax=Methylobacter sp. S3L5C TaxID=2839024 RepID=UPI001FAB968B|nr:flagellar brake protein [Methylobacter sp. S3L5C]UOA09565.1 flagellar brake protein [Methylobacter sp. S3L5C]
MKLMEDGTQFPDEQQYVIRNVKAIIQILTGLLNDNTMLNVSFNNANNVNDVCSTTVISLDEKNLSVHLDIGCDEAFNNRLIASQHVRFIKEDGIEIRWVSTKLSMTNLAGSNAIKIDLPKSMVRLQRREFYRIDTPIETPVLCHIPILDETNAEMSKILELPLVDISVGGVGMIAADPLDLAISIGTVFTGCKMDCPEIGMASLALQVQRIQPMPVKDGSTKYRIGFQYIAPSHGNERLIQLYTYQLERIAKVIK